MNVQIITSSYPAFPGDAGGTAGLFVQSFAQELARNGHTVIVQPVARKEAYQADPGITVAEHSVFVSLLVELLWPDKPHLILE